jgi:hypothetical protein
MITVMFRYRGPVRVVTVIHKWLYSPLLGPGLFFSSVIVFTQTVGPLGRVISPSQGHYLNTGQHKHRINAYTHKQNIMPCVGFEPTAPVFEREKTDHALDCARGNQDRHCAFLMKYKGKVAHVLN